MSKLSISKLSISKLSDLSVGEVSKRAGVAISALHFYEDKGLITSKRNASNHRRYERSVLRTIAIIKAAQRSGISLKEISTQLHNVSKDSSKITSEDWEKLSATWKQGLDDRIERLILLRDTLTQCIGCGCLSEKYCDLVNPEDELNTKGDGPVLLDPAKQKAFLKTFKQQKAKS